MTARTSVACCCVNDASREIGGTRAAAQLTDLARTSFVDGSTTGCIVAAVVTAVAAVLTLIYLPAYPDSAATPSA